MAIKDAQGSLRQLGIQYGVSHEEIRRIKRGERPAFPREKPPKVPRWKSQTTAPGTVVRAQITRASADGQYWLKLRLTPSDAAPIIAQVEQAIRDEMKALLHEDDDNASQWPEEDAENGDGYGGDGDNEDSEVRPYIKQGDGAYVFSFKTVKPYPGRKPTPPSFSNAKGGKLRKAERITNGARVAVTYAVVPWHRPYSALVLGAIERSRTGRRRGKANLSSQDNTGVGALLSLQGVTLMKPPLKTQSVP